MAHAREVIRKAVVTALTGLDTTGSNVETWRTHAVGEDERPHLSIMPGEDSEIVSEDVENEFGFMEVRDLPIMVEARAVQASGTSHTALADVVDDICAEVEVAMIADATLGGVAVDSRLLSTELSIDGSGERPVGLATMSWLIRYSVDRSDPANIGVQDPSSPRGYTVWYDVKAYGAKGDGVTDDTTAIQSTVNAAISAGRGTVFFPAGQYYVDGAISLASATKITLSMYGATILQKASAAPVAQTFTFNISGVSSDIRFEGGTIIGEEAVDGSGLSTIGHVGIHHVTGGTYLRTSVSDIHFELLAMGVSFGEEASQDISNCRIENCTFKDILGEASGTGYSVHLNGYDMLVSGCRFDNGCRHDVYCAKGGRFIVSDCVFRNHRSSYSTDTIRASIEIARVSDVLVSDCVFEGFKDGCVYIGQEQATSFDCKNVSVSGCSFNGNSGAVPAIWIGEQAGSSTHFTESVDISDNMFYMVGSSGTQECIRFGQGRNVSIAGNSFTVGGTLAASTNVMTIGHTTYTTTTNTDNLMVSGNKVFIDGGNASYTLAFLRLDGPMATSNIGFRCSDNTIMSVGTAPSATYRFNSGVTITNNKWSVHGLSGTNSPEGVVIAPIGSTYQNTTGGAGTTFYIKESGTGSTGWVAK